MSTRKPSHFSKTYLFTTTSPNKLSPASKSKHSVSPSLTFKREFVTNMPTLDHYRQLNKIALTDDNIRKIHEKLEVDAAAEKEFERRMKTQDLYVNYNQNPFSDEAHPDEDLPNTEQHPKKRNILEEINNLVTKNEAASIARRIPTPRTPAKDMHTKMLNQRNKHHLKATRHEKENVMSLQQTTQQQYVRTDFEALDEIITKPEPRFFEQKFKRDHKNIFQLVTGKNPAKFRSSKQSLEQIYFCFDSIIALTQKATVVNKALEEMSVFSRELAHGHSTKKTPERMLASEGDLNLNLDKLKFEELMMVATNKLRSDVLLRYFHEEEDPRKKTEAEEESEEEKKEKEVKVKYADGTRNQQTDFNPNNHDRAEIEYYNKSVISAIERRQMDLSQKYKDKLKRLIEMERLSINSTIEDRQVMTHFQDQKNEALLKGLESNVDKRLNLLKETERKIRLNKMNKNRTEKVKIDILIETFRMKKRLEAKGTRSHSRRKGSLSPTFKSAQAAK